MLVDKQIGQPFARKAEHVAIVIFNPSAFGPRGRGHFRDLHICRRWPNACFVNILRNLHKSKDDLVIGGVCGGLGQTTPVPAWIWRAAFLCALLFFGTGGLAFGELRATTFGLSESHTNAG